MEHHVASHRELERYCINETCFCDWRLTVTGCINSHELYLIHLVHIILTSLVTVIIIGIQYNRIVLKGHRLFDSNKSKGCFRPKPIDCMLFMLTFYNILRLISSVVIVTDVAPENVVARTFLFEIPWQFGYGAFTLYLVGIAQTLSDSYRSISNVWMPECRIDIFGSVLFITPFAINNFFSLLSGIYATSNVYLADLFTQILYILWFYHSTALTLSVLYAGIRLTRTLNQHILTFRLSGHRRASLNTGIIKIKIMVTIISTCMALFAVMLLLYGLLRSMTIKSHSGTIAIAVIWTYLGVIVTLFIECCILFK
ncbi:hypothetical protein BDF14DRAFT_1244013 [Spinellus fusiger]|nr:hypothetical protein BDF14DRAFT_1244013 [Spinellus fusiger]